MWFRSIHTGRVLFLIGNAVVTAGRTPLFLVHCLRVKFNFTTEVHASFKYFHSTLIMGRQSVNLCDGVVQRSTHQW